MDRTVRIFTLPFAAVVLVTAFAIAPAAGQNRAVAKPELTSVTSSDAGFQVRYPQHLVRCERLNGEDPDVWSPERDCGASIPVCDSSGHSGNVLMCLAYPTVGFQGSELQAAAFSVSRLDSIRTASECMQASRTASEVHGERIRGLKFQVAKVVETETSHVADHSIYRTFHKAACYELDVNITIALDSAFAAEDAPRKLTPPEREKIKAGLTQALEGFRFLK